MQDLDKQLEGMKQDLTGLQVWNPDSTSYYQADGADPYAYACGKHKADSFFNASGDSADLKEKIGKAIDNRGTLQNALTNAQEKYDEANARYCADKCGKRGNQPCHSECWSKERDKKAWGDALPIKRQNIADNEANIVKWQGELTTILGVEKTQAEEATKNESRKELAKQGLTPEAIEAKLTAEAKSKGRNKLILIGGAVVLIGVFGVMFLRRKNG